MKQAISFGTRNNELDTTVPSLINLDFFTGDKSSIPIEPIPVETKKKRGRPKKIDGQEIITNDTSQEDLPMYQSNEPYLDTYQETTGLLKNSVAQIDILQSEMKEQLDQIRSSKTLKRKYDYLSTLSATMATLISTKVSAVREINKTITDSHNLDMKRVKDLKLSAAENKDDDKAISDLYSAFISAPVGSYNGITSYQPPSNQELVMLTNGVQSTDIYQGYNHDYTVSPTVNNMLLRENSNIKTVVVYDENTGSRHFDIIDTSTGESIPNIERPDEMFLQNLTLDVRNGIARDINLDQTYQIIPVGNPNVNKY